MGKAEAEVGKNNGGRKVGIIVSGAALIDIAADQFMKDKFIDICSQAQVVLACRVSPKQKADVVNFVKERYP